MQNLDNKKLDINQVYFSAADELRKRYEKRCAELSKPLPASCSVPSKLFCFENKEGRVTIDLPDPFSNSRNLIYIILKISGKPCAYIGKTEQTFKKRVAGHLDKINSVERKVSDLYSQIFKKPEEFAVGILYQLKSVNERRWIDSAYDSSIDHVERKFIKLYSEKNISLYNCNKGGGGGRGSSSETPTYYAIPQLGLAETNLKSSVTRTGNKLHLACFDSIFKEYEKNRSLAYQEYRGFGAVYCFERHIQDSQGSFSSTLSNLGKQKSRNWLGTEITVKKRKINSFKSLKIGGATSAQNKPRVIRYIGMSGDVKERIQTHLRRASHYFQRLSEPSEFQQDTDCDFYRDLATYSHEFKVYILPISYLNPSNASQEESARFHFFNRIGETENHVIQEMKKTGRVYNKVNGGGGSIAGSLCQTIYPIPFKLS